MSQIKSQFFTQFVIKGWKCKLSWINYFFFSLIIYHVINLLITARNKTRFFSQKEIKSKCVCNSQSYERSQVVTTRFDTRISISFLVPCLCGQSTMWYTRLNASFLISLWHGSKSYIITPKVLFMWVS